MNIKYPAEVKLTSLIVGDAYRIRVSTNSFMQSSVIPDTFDFIATKIDQNIALIVTQDDNDIVSLYLNTDNISKNTSNTESVLVKCTEKDLCATAVSTEARANQIRRGSGLDSKG